MARVRLGVVLLLPQPVASEVDGLRRALGDRTRPLVAPHVTLVPPLNVAVDDVDEAVAVVRAAASGPGGSGGPLPLTIGPAATFAPATPVLYLAVAGDTERLARLRQAVLAGPLGRPPEWPFVPHVTIAPDAPAERLAAGVLALRDFRAAVTVDRIHVLQEGPDQAWRSVADLALGRPAVVGRGGLPVELAVSDELDPAARRFLDTAWEPRRQPFAVTARREGEVVAAALGETSGPAGEALVHRLVVAAAVRRQGIGSHVLAAVEHLAAQRGCPQVAAAVSPGDVAETFFSARGWRIDRGRPGVVRMVRALR